MHFSSQGHNSVSSYTAYLNREDPYNGNSSAHHYGNGPPLQSTSHYQANNSSAITQHAYPGPPPINHFGHQQDVYSSCSPSSRNMSYSPLPTMSTSASRHSLNSKAYWNCESISQQQQQQANHCYSANNTINSTHKSSPQTWSRSPNMISSPSTTPSPIPCPSTPHHFSSSPHQSHSDSTHKSYNGIMTSPSLPSNGNTGANINCNSNPLQSLQKMVQIDSESTDLRSQYDNSSTVPISAQANSQQHTPHSISGMESEATYPTYYNLDQNRLCATPQANYSNITAQSLNSAPFSPTLKNSQEIRNQQLTNNCAKQESSSENGELSLNRTSSVRFNAKLSKESPFLNNGSCSNDTCSNGSPSAQANKIVSIPDSVMQTDQTHDSINSFRGSETTANSRDSVKSTDSDAMSSYAVSQCPTPNNSWKLNSSAALPQSNEFRQTNFVSNTQSKSWWTENSLTPQSISECNQYGSSNVNYSPSQVSHQLQTQSNSSMSPSHSWSQQPNSSISTQNSVTQMISGVNYTSQSDGSLVVKKKRGRPFGSKNRRNLDTTQNPETNKRRRKIVLVDIGINTNLSFDVQANLYREDSVAFTESFGANHSTNSIPSRKKKPLGPVIRIDKSQSDLPNSKYSIVNSTKSQDDEKDKTQQAKLNTDSLNPPKKCSLLKSKKSILVSSNVNSNTLQRNWICILCHKGPHYKGLGDLYGPYVISLDKSKLSMLNDNEASCVITSHEEVEVIEHQPPERRSLRRRVESSEEKSKSANNNSSHNTTEESKECVMSDVDVWIHEDCIVWSNNVYLEGTKIRNLEPAIMESFDCVSVQGYCR